MDTETQKEIKHVEEVLEDIRDNTQLPWWRVILNGFLHGTGIVIGTTLGIAALGWILSIFGIIPGVGEIAAYLQNIVQSRFH